MFPLIFSLIFLLIIPSTVIGWGYGLNRVQTAQEDSEANTGYGPGWVGLSYKPNGPIVGYLFAEGFQFSDGAIKGSFDHKDIRGTTDVNTPHPTIDRWPWGYAHGGFDGCADAYGTSKFAFVGGYSSSQCVNGPNVPGDQCSPGPFWHSETVFCTDNAADPLCSPVGVWSECKTCEYGVCGTKPVKSHGCPAYGNIGATAAYGSGAPVVQHPLGFVPAGSNMDLRYVTKDKQYVMAKWHEGELISGIEWAFFPRSCVSEEGPGPTDQVWVDFNYAGPEQGTEQKPFNTLSEGTNAVNPGGEVIMKPGTSGERPTLSKPMYLKSSEGTVTIGE